MTNKNGNRSMNTNTSSRKSTENKNLKWILLGSAAAALIAGYFTLGLFLTLFLAFGLGMILGIAYLLDKTKSKKKQRRILNIVLIVFLTFAILGSVAVGGFLFYVVKTAPDFDVAKLEKKESSIIYDNNGNEIVRLGSELRENVTYDDLPEVFIDALIATEDSRFFQHNGFDAPRFLIASIKQAAGQKDAGGASTLSMQVIKNSITSTEATGFDGIVRKFTDIYLSIFKLEKNFTKEEIIEFYVNNHFLGNNSFGVEQASKIYFGKSVRDLNLTEAATLVGMFQAPSSYDPYKNPSKTYARRSTVLNLMVKHGYITKEEADAAKMIPIDSLLIGKDSSAREFQGYIDTVISELEGQGIFPYSTPLLIYTNMDRNRQQGLDDIFNGKTFSWINDVVQSGVAVVENSTGKLVAVGAGRNKKDARTFNYTTKNTRQIGSTAKPIFDYGPGFEHNNWSTYTQFVDEPYTYSNGTSVNNSDRKFKGQMSLRTALADSRNIPALKAFQQVDNKKIIEFVQSLGITPEISNGKIHEAHSLGSFKGATPLEMAAAYAAFANGGYYIKPYTVNKIINRTNGDVTTFESEKKRVMSDSTAYMMTDILMTSVKSGLSSGAKIDGVNLAAKTGTTSFTDETKKANGLPSDAINDAWVVGYDPQYAVSMWYGYDKIDKNYVHRNTPAVIQRGKLYKAIGNVIYNKNNQQFNIPNSVTKVGVENGSNPAMLPSTNTPADQITYEYFKKGTEPTEVSSKNQKLDTVKNLKVSYSKANEKITITWDKLNAAQGSESYGDFGYNVYYGDVLLGFTTSNKYTIDATLNISGTYKVVTTFKNYSGNQSTPAVYNFTYNEEPEIDVYKAALVGSSTGTLALNGTFTDVAIPINILKNDTVITSQIDIDAILTSIVLAPDGTTVTSKQGGGVSFTGTQAGIYTIQYKISYGGNNYTLLRKITVS